MQNLKFAYHINEIFGFGIDLIDVYTSVMTPFTDMEHRLPSPKLYTRRSFKRSELR